MVLNIKIEIGCRGISQIKRNSEKTDSHRTAQFESRWRRSPAKVTTLFMDFRQKAGVMLQLWSHLLVQEDLEVHVWLNRASFGQQEHNNNSPISPLPMISGKRQRATRKGHHCLGGRRQARPKQEEASTKIQRKNKAPTFNAS